MIDAGEVGYTAEIRNRATVSVSVYKNKTKGTDQSPGVQQHIFGDIIGRRVMTELRVRM